MTVPSCVVAIVLAALLAAAPAGAQESQVRDAIAARFPDGIRRCVPLPHDVVGIHVQPPQGGTLWYPLTGPTSPDRHPFVLYAAPAADPVPDLVSDLASRGMVRRKLIQAATDVQRQQLGPQTRDQNGMPFHPTVFSHERGTVQVAIYETAPADPAFRYETSWGAGVGQRFASRLYDTPLPPPDKPYAVPLTTPYAVSMVAAACLTEVVEDVSDVQQKTLWTGAPYVQATVSFRQEAPDWMRTPVFARAALRPDSPSLTAPRRATVVFSIEGGKLVYGEEERRP